MKTVIDVDRILSRIETGCADLRKAFEVVEDELCGEENAKHIILIDRDKGAENGAEEKDCALEVLLDAMPEVTPEHRAELLEAFQLMEDERDMAVARAEAAEKHAASFVVSCN